MTDIYISVRLDLRTKTTYKNNSHVSNISIMRTMVRLVYLQYWKNNGGIQVEGCTKVEIKIKVIPLTQQLLARIF